MQGETGGAVSGMSNTILVVDDEASICRTLEGIFQDEGYRTLVAHDGPGALQILRTNKPSAVLLDIWMPGMDGLEILNRIKQHYPDVPVVMISGHATIATAVKATRLGAADFIEKPLDLHQTLEIVRRAIRGAGTSDAPEKKAADEIDPLLFERTLDMSQLNCVAFKSQPWRGKAFPQRTLARTALLYGQGLHSGRKSGLILEPLPPNSGIQFVGVSETAIVPAHIDFVGTTGFATTIKVGGTQAATIEHLMSALHAYGVTNLLVKCNGEVPVMDGSAREFCRLFEEAGVETQNAEVYEIAVKRAIRVEHGKEYITLEPAEAFKVEYILQYAEPIGRQQKEFVLTSAEDYKREIAPARTFGFVKDISALQSRGLALGGRFDNFVLIGEDGAINDQLRYQDEPVRHKILDAIGDLYLLGRPIRGKVTAFMTGHSDNIALLRALKNEMVSEMSS